jgi:hypothetical protein
MGRRVTCYCCSVRSPLTGVLTAGRVRFGRPRPAHAPGKRNPLPAVVATARFGAFSSHFGHQVLDTRSATIPAKDTPGISLSQKFPRVPARHPPDHPRPFCGLLQAVVESRISVSQTPHRSSRWLVVEAKTRPIGECRLRRARRASAWFSGAFHGQVSIFLPFARGRFGPIRCRRIAPPRRY